MRARPVGDELLDLDPIAHAVRLGMAAQRRRLGQEVRIVGPRSVEHRARREHEARDLRRRARVQQLQAPIVSSSWSSSMSGVGSRRKAACSTTSTRSRANSSASCACDAGAVRSMRSKAILRSRRWGRRRSRPTTRMRGARAASRSARRCPRKVRRPVIATVAGALTRPPCAPHTHGGFSHRQIPCTPMSASRSSDDRGARDASPFSKTRASASTDRPPGHPERPERLRAVGRAIAERRDRLMPLAARPADDDEILRVHAARAPAHGRDRPRAWPRGISTPTPTCRARASRSRVLAAGAAIELGARRRAGALRRGVRRRAPARPPRRGRIAPWASACSTTSRSRRARCRRATASSAS